MHIYTSACVCQVCMWFERPGIITLSLPTSGMCHRVERLMFTSIGIARSIEEGEGKVIIVFQEDEKIGAK